MYDWHKAQEEGREFELPPDINDEEIIRLGTLISEAEAARELPPQRYAREFMPAGMTPDEALAQAIRNSAPPPRPVPRPAAPALPAMPAYAPPVPNWPWEVPAFVQIPDDDEDDQ